MSWSAFHPTPSFIVVLMSGWAWGHWAPRVAGVLQDAHLRQAVWLLSVGSCWQFLAQTYAQKHSGFGWIEGREKLTSVQLSWKLVLFIGPFTYLYLLDIFCSRIKAQQWQIHTHRVSSVTYSVAQYHLDLGPLSQELLELYKCLGLSWISSHFCCQNSFSFLKY